MLDDLNQYPKPRVMVDIAIFTVADQALKVLLIQRGIPPFQGQWTLPGGALRIGSDASLEAAARRELVEETGVNNLYLEQLGSYGSPERDPREWTVSIAYFALVSAHEVELRLGTDATTAQWFAILGDKVDLPLAFDHATILRDATKRLRAKLDYSDIAVHLLPKEFTLSELQQVYELIMQEKLNKSSFRQRVDKAQLVQPIPNKMRTGSNRPAQLYQFVPCEQNRIFFPRSLAWAQKGNEK